MIEIPTWTEWAGQKLNEIQSPYSDRFHRDLEMQFMPIEDDDDALDRWRGEWPIVGDGVVRKRIPRGGKSVPVNNDGPVEYHPNLIARFGTSWWNWRLGQTEAAGIDFDFGHGSKGLTEEQIADVDRMAERLPHVMNCTSRGGKGRQIIKRAQLQLVPKPVTIQPLANAEGGQGVN